MHLFLQAGRKNPPEGCEPVGAVSAGGFVRVGKPHANACSGLLAAATAGLPRSPEQSRSPLTDQSHRQVPAVPPHLSRKRAKGS